MDNKSSFKDISMFLGSIMSQTFFFLYIAEALNSFLGSFVLYVCGFIIWNQILINRVLDKTDLKIENPDDHEEIARQAMEEKSRLWPYYISSWLVLPAICEFVKIVLSR